MKFSFTLLSLFIIFTTYSQDNFADRDLLNAYQEYTELPRETAFVHLNKSTYIKGENMGFNAYILDKENKKYSTETTNLYCVISDQNNKVIKQKLVMINQGVGRGDFEIDSLFTSGEYTFKAYTNWMRNFNEPNHFIQNIKVIDPDVTSEVKPKTVKATIDAQFLPEGGHLVTNLESIVGVVIKDSLGFGIPSLEGKVVDANNKLVTSFKVNSMGIGRFPMHPKTAEVYTAKINYNGTVYSFPIDNIALKGISIKVQDLKDKVGITLQSNAASKTMITAAPYILAIHNGKEVKALDVTFDNALEVIKIIPHKDLYPGINILTLFDAKNNPIVERIIFNYDGINFVTTKTPSIQKGIDTLSITLPIQDADASAINNISISVLPSDTQSYKLNHNLPSYSLLQPYVKGIIENARYYFTDINAKKKYELDMLLLTQGWSSYAWNTVFNKAPDYNFDFEKGISLTANNNSNKVNQFFFYPLANSASEFIALKEGRTAFQKKELFPLGEEKIRIGAIKNKGALDKSALYLQFAPSKIPELKKNKLKSLRLKEEYTIEATEVALMSITGTQQLDEVVLTKKRASARVEKLRNRTLGKIDFFGEREIIQYQYFANYLSQRGYIVIEDFDGSVAIASRNAPSPNNSTPIIYLDGALLTDFDILYRFRLDVVDYIEVNNSGIGGGLRGGGGIIKIVTDPQKRFAVEKKDVFSEFSIPLTFSTPKRFYTPKYASYTSNFFNSFGVVGWFPNLKVDTQGNVTFKIENNGVSNMTLYVEGLINNGDFLSEKIDINIE